MVVGAIAWAGCLIPLYRYGVVAGIAAIFTVNILGIGDPANSWSAWYATPGLITAGLIAALAGWGFYLALAGRAIVRSDALVRA
jgi:hypothetical protein